jgi:hypothetical protein
MYPHTSTHTNTQLLGLGVSRVEIGEMLAEVDEDGSGESIGWLIGVCFSAQGVHWCSRRALSLAARHLSGPHPARTDPPTRLPLAALAPTSTTR